ncbi:MAG: 4Fe-4S dicluster domain-containing protein [Planctomycetaceae bacterium]|jgi:ferredoxin|nr:4Fe-4S dicluster domain-containing protein [Planctomycetaceae bacterium]
MSKVLTSGKLNEVISFLISGGKQVVAPVLSGDKYFYCAISDSGEAVFDSAVKSSGSVKEFFFPRHEKICGYCHEGKELVVTDAELFSGEQVIFGVRPCEAASLPILDKVFGWDFQDRFFQMRRERTTVITLACEPDDFCFCTSVGLAPDMELGADAMLIPAGKDNFEVRIFTDKGSAIFDGNLSETKSTSASETESLAATTATTTATTSTATTANVTDKTTDKAVNLPESKFEAAYVQRYLTDNFADEVFDRLSIRCLGCGVCTYVCPTCHCFDIVDEGGAFCGERVKNWDSCQFAFFTHHASGHNPRGNQSARQRNRIQHKFRIYPEKFGHILCTGCGNCARQCSVTLGVLPYVEELEKKAKASNPPYSLHLFDRRAEILDKKTKTIDKG